MAITYRKAELDDLAAVWRLVQQFYAEESYAQIDRERAQGALRTLLGDDRLGSVWLVEEGAEAQGYALLCHGFSLEYGGRDAFLDEFFVCQALRGRGLGTKLLDAAEAGARQAGVGAVHLEVEGANPRAASLYARRGFAGNQRRLLTKVLGSG